MQLKRLPVLPFLLYAVALLYIFFNRENQRTNRIYEFDKGGYYCYLPAAFIHNDLAHLRRYLQIDAERNLSDQWFQGGSHVHPVTGRRVVKYSAGVAMAELPAFLIAHALAGPLGYETDGFSPPYAVAIGATGILFSALGLWWLALLLARRFPRRTVWLTVAAIGLGTNLYTYAAFEPGMSHPISFGLVSGFFFFMDGWYRSGRHRSLVFAALLLGWITVLRPVNALVAFPAFFWDAGTGAALRTRLKFLAGHARQLPFAALAFALMLVPQLLYWKYVTGSWVYYSYTNEGFNWTHPQIWNGLFSYKRGWMVYTPLAFVASIGFGWMIHRNVRQFLLPAFFGIAGLVYVVFCWEQWYYGAGFGARALIDVLPLMALPLAVVINAILAIKSAAARSGMLLFIFALVGLNIFQSYQYGSGVIHYNDMNRAYYWRVFGKLSVSENDRALLE